jgi:ribosomal protein S18 acetylase RimI-like enzyme
MDATAPEFIEVAAGPERDRWVSLLELADEPEPLRAYLQEGDLYGLVGPDGAPRAAILVIEESPGVAELRNVAVAEAVQDQGVGTLMMNATLFVLAQRGVQRAVVGTASSGVRQIAFYQRCGFRLSHVERDFFTPEKGYPDDLRENGIPIRDMVWMDRDVAARSLGG